MPGGAGRGARAPQACRGGDGDLVVVAVVGRFAILPHGGTSTHGTARPPVRAAAAAAPPVLDAAESGLLPWHLAAPLSREVVVPGPPGQLIALGGLTSAGASASGVYAVRTATDVRVPVI